MKRIIIQLLICTIFYSGLAFSSDSHDEAFYGHASEFFLDIDPHNQSNEIDDHGCHATVHMTGLFSPTTEVLYVPLNSNTHYSLNRIYSFYITPPTPPPTL